MEYIKSIKCAITEACYLKSGIADWSGIGDLRDRATKGSLHMEAYIRSYAEFRQTIWGATYINLLGKHVQQQLDRTVNVLDVGSGKCKTIRNMTNGNMENAFDYVSIDHATDHNIFGSRHFKADVFTDTIDLGNDYQFDVLIIDIEPHGKEIEIYEKLAMYGAPKHVVILKCVGWMDTMVTTLADRFLNHLKDSNRLIDYFGIGDSNFFTRDVTIIASREADVFVGEISRHVETSGGQLSQSFSNKNYVPTMICWSTKELIEKMLIAGRVVEHALCGGA